VPFLATRAARRAPRRVRRPPPAIVTAPRPARDAPPLLPEPAPAPMPVTLDAVAEPAPAGVGAAD